MSMTSRSMKLYLQFLCTILCLGLITSCTKSTTPGGLPAACASSSSPYLEYTAGQIRQAVAFAYGYEAYRGTDGENGLNNLMIGPEVRYANISLNVWLKAHSECRVGAVAKLADALAAIDDSPFGSKDLPAVKALSFVGVGASDSLGLSIGFSPIPGPDTNNQDVYVPRPVDVVGTPKSYDDREMIISLNAKNTSE